MKLVITEKPSVAQSIAKVVGANQRRNGYLEGNGYLVSWCVGHLVELAEPRAYNEKYDKWRKEDLPIFPEIWKYQVTASTKKQYAVLKELMFREDVDSLIEATDAGREGELIFRLVYNQCKCKKPFERLWISSMEDEASLSAILLDDDYYQILLDGKIVEHGLSVLRPEYLILFKAKACLDLKARKERGEQVDSSNMKKHKNDILRIVVEMVLERPNRLPDLIIEDIEQFLDLLSDDPFDANLLKSYGLKSEEVISRMIEVYR